MKTDRFASVTTRAAAALLAGVLLFAAAADGQVINFRFKSKKKSAVEVISTGLAAALALQVGEVQKRFDANRRALRTVASPGGVPAYPRQEVAGLIARTGEDLDQAMGQIGEPDLDGLRAWAAEELRLVQEELAPGRTAALCPGPSTPCAVAVVASLGGFPEPVDRTAAAPRQETIPAETSDRLLDLVGAVVSRIFFLAERNDLEVKLWVGSAPAQRAMFSFWPQGKVKGSTPESLVIRTNGKKDHVLRGLYSYSASLSKGAVTELVEYPSRTGTAMPRTERLDLVNGPSFFCCWFSEQSCRHVDNEKDCRP